MPRDQTIPLEGELNCWTREFDVPDILLTICETERTGLLRFVSSEAEKTVFVRRGRMIFAKSSSTDDRLGEFLLRRGELSLKDLQRIAQEVRPGKRLGTLLVENGMLEPQGLVHAVVGQVRSIILSLFRWTEARYGFTEQTLPSQETITLNMPTEQLIVEGVLQVDSWRRISRGLGDIDSVYRTVPGTESALKRLDLDTASLEMLAVLVHPRNVLQICGGFPLSDLDVCRRLWAFRTLRWIERTDAAPVPLETEMPPAAAIATLDEDAAAEEPEIVEIEAETGLDGFNDEGAPALPTSVFAPENDSPISLPKAAAANVAGRGHEGSSASASLADLDAIAEDSSRVESRAGPAKAESPKKPMPSREPEGSIVSTEDTDLEGLGLILGDNRSE